MAGDRLTGFSSAFDEALDRNRRQLDELFSKSQSGVDPLASSTGERPASMRPSGGATVAGSPRFDAQASDTVRRLNQRFGERWRYTIAEDFREADEIIVRCELTLPESGVRKAQFGSARIADGGGSEVSGAVDGVGFSLQLADATAGQGSQGAEQKAFQKAVEAALARCEAML